MRRILLIAAVLFMGVAAWAQDNSHRIGLGAGVSYHLAGDAVLFREHYRERTGHEPFGKPVEHI